MTITVRKTGPIGVFGLACLALAASPQTPAHAQATILGEQEVGSPAIASSSAAPASTATSPPASHLAQQSETAEEPDRINYFGIGGTLGLSDGGGTSLGDGGFSLMGRFSITDNISVHSASVISGDSVATFALTGGAPVRDAAGDRTLVYPFAGAGLAIETDDFELDPMITGGVDIPITDIVTGTARVNASFGEDGTDVGLVFGVGVDFLELF